MADKLYIERLQQVIFHLHKAASTWVETVPVREVFQGQIIWQGKVEVFDLSGHPKAKRCYAWSHLDGKNDEGERAVAVIGVPPVDSAQSAVKVAIASEVRSKTLDKKRGRKDISGIGGRGEDRTRNPGL